MAERRRFSVASWVCAAALCAGCASTPREPGPDDPGPRLRRLLAEWYAVQDAGGSCASGGRRHPYVDCGRIQAGIERLSLQFPDDATVLAANAVVAFETRQEEKAQVHLDALFELDPIQPDAAILRSRLSIRQGNLSHARRLLESQIGLSPDHAGLREAMASLHYLRGAHALAQRELAIAERLGAPGWRVDYHRGLLEEAQGRADTAIRYYQRSIDANPGWERPRSRLRGLESERGL